MQKKINFSEQIWQGLFSSTTLYNVVSQCKLVSGWRLRKEISTKVWAVWLGIDFFNVYILFTVVIMVCWLRIVSILNICVIIFCIICQYVNLWGDVWYLLQFLCIKNIKVFLQACRNFFAMSENDLFKASDLFDGSGMQKVGLCAVFASDIVIPYFKHTVVFLSGLICLHY